MAFCSRTYHDRVAHPQEDFSFPVPHTPPHQPHYYDSTQMPLSSPFSQGHPSPLAPYPPYSSPQPFPPNRNHQGYVSTVASPTPPASSFRRSFSTRTSFSDSASALHKHFCVHDGCDKKFASWSVLMKHEREKHVKRTAVCNRCPWRSPRKHRHPATCSGTLTWRVIRRKNGYPCGGCEKRFDSHGEWCKHIKDHQLNDKPKSEWDITWVMRSLLKLEIFERAVSQHPQGHLIDRMSWNACDTTVLNGFEEADYGNNDPSFAVSAIIARASLPRDQVNPSLWVEPAQNSSPSEAQIPAHHLPVLADSHANVERELAMSPNSESVGSPASLPSPSPVPIFSGARPQHILDDFNRSFSPSAVSDSIPREAPPTNFEFPSTSYWNPLPDTRDYSSSSPQYSHRESSHGHSRSSPSPIEDNECAEFAPPLMETINPQLLLSDAGSWWEETDMYGV